MADPKIDAPSLITALRSSPSRGRLGPRIPGDLRTRLSNDNDFYALVGVIDAMAALIDKDKYACDIVTGSSGTSPDFARLTTAAAKAKQEARFK